jgi:hypothetical protein
MAAYEATPTGIFRTIKARRDILSHRGSPPRAFAYGPPNLPGQAGMVAAAPDWEGFTLTSDLRKHCGLRPQHSWIGC